MLRSPLQRAAMRLHIVGSTPAPLPEAEMEVALYLNLGVAVVGGVAILAWGAPWEVALATFAIVFVLLSLALYHRWLRWVSVALGTMLSTGIGVVIGMFANNMLHMAIGAGVGLTFAALGYGRLVVQLVRKV